MELIKYILSGEFYNTIDHSSNVLCNFCLMIIIHNSDVRISEHILLSNL